VGILTDTLQKVGGSNPLTLIQLAQTGRLPSLRLQINPLSGAAPIILDRFLSYSVDNSLLTPVDSFDFTFAAPDTDLSSNNFCVEGDIVKLYGNDQPIGTGIIDTVEIEVDNQYGEKVTVTGRDLMGQYEDQDTILLDGRPIIGDETVASLIRRLNQNTRISNDIVLVNAPTGTYPFSTEPGEKKLAALQRYLEPLNILAWMNPAGQIVVGKPTMKQSNVQGKLFCLREKKDSNVLDMRVIRSSTQIPNVIAPIWSAQESTTDRVTVGPVFFNAAPGPNRLRKLGHRVIRAVVASTPAGDVSQALADANRLRAAGANIMQGYAKREMARANFDEIQVHCTVPSHYNERGVPYMVDQCYQIQFDRGGIEGEAMYLHHVKHFLDEKGAQRSRLSLCRFGTIVADILAV
jgi:prophage tail gpP-like protein